MDVSVTKILIPFSCIGVIPSLYEIPPKMLGKNLNFVGALEKEYSIGSDGQYFENGAYINKFKKNEDFMFKTEDTISVYFYLNELKFFKNGTILQSFDVGFNKEFYLAVTLFGLSPSIESVNPQLFTLCVPKNVGEKSVQEAKNLIVGHARSNTLVPGQKRPLPPKPLPKKRTESLLGSNPSLDVDSSDHPMGFKDGEKIALKTQNGTFISLGMNGVISTEKFVTENSTFEIEHNLKYLQLKSKNGYLKINKNVLLKIEKKGYGYLLSSTDLNSKYLGVTKQEVVGESLNPEFPGLIFFIEYPKITDKKTEPSTLTTDPLKSLSSFQHGSVISLKSYWGNYFYYSQNIPSLSDKESRETQFLVEKIGNKYRLTNEFNIPIVCTSPNDYLFTITEHSNPKVNGYSLLSEGGRYLGVSQDSKILLYTSDDNKETRFYPIGEGTIFYGIGPFQQGSTIYLKSIFGYYLSFGDYLKPSLEKSENCKFIVEQQGSLFKLKAMNSAYVYTFTLSDTLLYVKCYPQPEKNGFTLFSNGYFLGISQEGKMVLNQQCNNWESRFFPELFVENNHMSIMTNPFSSMKVENVVQKTMAQIQIPKPRIWEFNKELLSLPNIIEKPTYKVVLIPPDHQEYAKISKQFDQTYFRITHVYCVYNQTLDTLFSHRLETLSIRMNKEAFKPNWGKETNVDQRMNVLKRIKTFVSEEYKGVNIVPVYHGCSKESVYEICETGFANLKLTDSGFFGTGSYGTTQSDYSCRVYGKGVTLLCYTCFASAYPVIEGDMQKLTGKSSYSNFDAHYAAVSPKDSLKHQMRTERNYYPTKKGQTPTYDEFVVFQENQIIPRYIIYYEKK
jgi:hypothetical protein